MRTLLLLAVLLCCVHSSFALVEVVPIGAFANGVAGGLFQGGWWFYGAHAMITFVVFMAAKKRSESEEVLVEFALYGTAAVIFGHLTGVVARLLFRIPQLLDMRLSANVEYDVTDEATLWELEENARAQANCMVQPYPCAVREHCTVGVVALGPTLFTFGAVLGQLAYYLFTGEFDGVWGESRARINGTIIVILAVLALVLGAVEMMLLPRLGERSGNNASTLKYLLALGLVLTAPVLYDAVFKMRFLVRGFIMVAVYAVLWVAVFAYATYVWSDRLLYGKTMHALWFAILGFIPSALGYIGGGIANDRYPGNAFAALMAVLAAFILSLILYAAIRFSGVYRGVDCTPCKTH